MWKQAFIRAEKTNKVIDITLDDLYDILPKDMICPVLKVKMVYGNDDWKNSPSLDCIDPTRGYVKGNTAIISYLANAMKSAATPDELNRFADWVKENY